MRIGDRVTYVSTDGRPSAAVVTQVKGSGPSLYKILDLDVSGAIVRDVLHANDANGGAHWTADPVVVARIVEPPLNIELPELYPSNAHDAHDEPHHE